MPDLATPSPRRRLPLLAFVLAVEVAIVVIDVATGTDNRYTTVYLLGPLLIALGGRRSDVKWIGAVALGLAAFSGLWNDFFGSLDHVFRTFVVAVAVILAWLCTRAIEVAVAARREIEEARGLQEAARRRLGAILGSLAEAVTVHDGQGRTVYANQPAAELLGLDTVDEVLAADLGELAARFEVTREDGTPVTLDDYPGGRALRGEAHEPLLTRSVRVSTGRHHWYLTKAGVAYDDDGSPLAVNVIEDVTASKDAELAQRFLADAGQVLAGSLDYGVTLERVAQLAVPGMADWCAVDLVDDRGRLERVALAHQDPGKVALGQELGRRYPPRLDLDEGLGGVLRTGTPLLYSEITDEMLEAGAIDAEHLALIRSLGMRSAMIVPMARQARVLGAMTFVTSESYRAFDETSLAVAMDLASRAAVAVDNARLYTARDEMARTLQRSLLPDRLPSLDGFVVAAAYRAGERESEVGGDFYDVFEVGGAVLVVLGDVTGKGVAAASLTQAVRHTAKTAARFDALPAAVLRAVNAMLTERDEFSPVTVVCARIERSPTGATAEIASGGHPLPLRIDGTGRVEPVGEHGVLLGVVEDREWPQATVPLEPGDTLLFFTDGVTDTPGAGGHFGEARLLGVAAGEPRDPDALVARIEAMLADFEEGRVIDDRALLAIQLTGVPAGLAQVQ